MNEIEIVVKSQDKSDLDKIATKAKQAGKEIGDGVQKGMDKAEDASGRGSKKIRDNLDDVRKAGDKAGDGLAHSLGEALDGIASELSGSLGDLGGALDSGISAAKGGAVAAGVGLAAFVFSGMQAEFAEDKVGGLLAAQTGAASSAAEGLGNTAGDVFTDNFGDSIEQVGDAMKSVFENKLVDTSAAQGDIEKVTEKVITLSQVTGEEFGRIGSATSRMVKNDIGGSVSEAMDLIGKAQQNGLNAQGDLIDTLEEYSTKFHDLGLNGQESLGLIQQAMEGGARNTDVAADALKEFSIRAQDMSEITRRGFESIGLDADVMGQRIAAGGSSAKGALQDTLNALEALPPGVQRNSAAVDLFGTKAEDLGKALYDMDLDTAAKKFGDFGGTVEEQMQKINDSTSFWDKLGKGISGAANSLGEFLDKGTDIELPDDFKNTLEEVSKAQKSFDATGNTKALDDLKQKYPEAAEAIDAYVKKKHDEKAANDEAAESTEAYTTTIDKLIAKQKEASEGVLGLSEAQIRHEEAIDAADQALIDNGKNLDLTTEKGRNNQSALNDIVDTTYSVIEAMRAQGLGTQEVQGFMDSSRKSFVDHAQAMGMDATQANQLADKLGLIPGNYNAKIIVDNGQALHAFSAVQNAIAGIPRNINVAINQTLNAISNQHKATGGIVSGAVWGAATGGQRHSSTVIDEVGPELVELPDGSRVATAGATRAMGEAGWLGGGGSGVVVQLSMDSSDPLIRAIMGAMRYEVLDRYGGSVSKALGKAGVT